MCTSLHHFDKLQITIFIVIYMLWIIRHKCFKIRFSAPVACRSLTLTWIYIRKVEEREIVACEWVCDRVSRWAQLQRITLSLKTHQHHHFIHNISYRHFIHFPYWFNEPFMILNTSQCLILNVCESQNFLFRTQHFIIVYSPSCQFRPVEFPFFCRTQSRLDILKNVLVDLH